MHAAYIYIYACLDLYPVLEKNNCDVVCPGMDLYVFITHCRSSPLSESVITSDPSYKNNMPTVPSLAH